MKIGRLVLLTVFCLTASVIFLQHNISDEGAYSSVMGDMSDLSREEQGSFYGVEMGVAGFLGETEYGPIEPRVVGSYAEYEKLYGGYTGRSFLSYSVRCFFENGGEKLYIARVISGTATKAKVKPTSGKKPAITIEARYGGDSGNRIAVKISAGTDTTEEAPTIKLEVYWFNYQSYSAAKGKPNPSEANLYEVYDNVSLQDSSPFNFKNYVNSRSDFILINLEEGDVGIIPDAKDKLIWCTGGTDGEAPVLTDYVGHDGLDGNSASGLSALGKINILSTLYAPESYAIEGLDHEMIAQCESLGDRTVIIDTAFASPTANPWHTHESSYAACYTPWLAVEGVKGKAIMVPPGGAIAGTYAKNDVLNGPNQSPINLALQGVNSIERHLSQQEQDALSIRRINPIILNKNVGNVACGGMTLSALDDEFKTINLRRYTNYLRDSISEGLGWATGLTWDEELQSRIKTSIEKFLYQQWKRGALFGKYQKDTFTVDVNQIIITQNGYSKPIISIDLNVALVKPNQFIKIKINK